MTPKPYCLTLRLTEAQRRELKRRQEETGVPITVQIRRALDQVLGWSRSSDQTK